MKHMSNAQLNSKIRHLQRQYTNNARCLSNEIKKTERNINREITKIKNIRF